MKPLIAVAKGHSKESVVWMMRQAGRYLPEYRSLRQSYDTLTMFMTPKIATEVTLQPLKRFPLDAAIVYADILLLPHALGFNLTFLSGEGPRFSKKIINAQDVRLVCDVAQNQDLILNRLDCVMETLEQVKGKLSPKQALIGFAGAPWTVAAYMIEGGSSQNGFETSKSFLYNSPELAHQLLQAITDLTIGYLKRQIRAGAELIQVFESWGGVLTPTLFKEFSAPYAKQVVSAIEQETGTPTIWFVGEAGGVWKSALENPCSVYGVDWRLELEDVSAHPLAERKALQGNLDPVALLAHPKFLEKEVQRIMSIGRKHPGGFIFNLGHGIKQNTPPEQVGAVVEWVHKGNDFLK